MRQVNVHEAKTQLSKLLEAVERGEEVTIARNGRPVATLNRVASPRRAGFGSVPEFEAWTPERLAEIDQQLAGELAEAEGVEQQELSSGFASRAS